MSGPDFQSPLKRVRGLGSARSGTSHFIAQRATALALVFLAPWAIFLALTIMHADYAQARAILHHPLAATALAAFVLALFWHAQLGLRVVIEDYVHSRCVEIAAQLAVKFLCIAAALASVFAIARVALA